ncbi:MAG: hypothetical protein FWE37_07475 [Spirochaetaceae bacterium]|nr:hypothetical protein [Spirochaetaceae bacterium]
MKNKLSFNHLLLATFMLAAWPSFAQQTNNNPHLPTLSEELSTYINFLRRFAFIDVFTTARASTANFTDNSLNRFNYIDFINHNKFYTIGFDFSYRNFDFYFALDLIQTFMIYNDNFAWSSLPLGKGGFVDGLDTTVPLAGYIAYDTDFITLSVGRRRMALGPGDYSLVVGRDNPFLDGVFFGIRPRIGQNSRFSYYFIGASDDGLALNNFVTWNKEAAVANPAASRWFENDSMLQQISRYFLVHKIAFSSRNFKIGLTESFVVSGLPLTFWLANPFMIWHNTYLDLGGLSGNVAITLDVERRFNNLRVYGEFSLDDWQLGWEGVETHPNSIGLYVGLDWQVFAGDELFSGVKSGPYDRIMREDTLAFESGLVVSLQFVYVSRYFYRRHHDDPLGKFTFFNSLQHTGDNRDFYIMENYLGFAYGPDSFLTEFTATWQNRQIFSENRLGLLFLGSDNLASSGHIDRNHSQPQGTFTPNENSSRHWGFSSLAQMALTLQSRNFLALNSFTSFYFGANGRIILNKPSLSRVMLETGLFISF